MSKFDDFYNSHVNRAWDKFGKEYSGTYPQNVSPFGGQCVSLIKTYLYNLFGDKVLDSYGDAIDYWTGRNTSGILKLCSVVNTPQNGDIVVSAGSDPRYGHIWIWKDGQAFTQNCESNPKARLCPVSWQGTIYGYLRPNINEPVLIPEHRLAIVKDGHNINIRKGSVTGTVVRTAKPGDVIEYTEKVVTNGHRYVSWIESGSRYYMAVTPTEEQKDHWVTIAKVTAETIIDISAHQGTIDFSKVKNEVDGVILRCGYGTTQDDRFLEYAEGCRKNNIPIKGLYVFDYAINNDQALAEADFIVRCAKQIGLDKSAVLYFDCEGDSVRYASQNGVNLNADLACKFTRSFMDRVKSLGYTTGYYSNLDWANNRYKNFQKKSDEKFWFARYDHTPELTYDLLQYSSSGKVSGIAGSVDMNRTGDSPVNSIEYKEPAKETWNINGIVKVGSVVKSVSCAITGIKGDLVNVPALGGYVPLSDVSEADDTGDGAKDNYLATTKARVFLDPVTVTEINIPKNLAKVNGYWVNCTPLMVKE